MVPKPITGWKRAALNVFIGLHVAGLLFWGLPDGPFRNRMARPFEKYIVYMGLWHIWGMFAPAPLNINFDVRGVVKYQDGSTAEWICPRMEELPVFARASKERYRKWRERIRSEEYTMIWDDTAHWIARELNNKPNNPPVEVKMVRWWSDVAPPRPNQDYQPREQRANWTNSYTYAVLPIAPKDLQ